MRSVIKFSATLLALLCGAAACANPDSAPRRYSLKALDSAFATPYARKVASGSAIPFDKT